MGKWGVIQGVPKQDGRKQDGSGIFTDAEYRRIMVYANKQSREQLMASRHQLFLDATSHDPSRASKAQKELWDRHKLRVIMYGGVSSVA